MTLQDLLLRLARAAIEERFGKPFSYSKEILCAQFPELGEKRATFVTINVDGDSLRGCIGSLLPHATLYDDIIYNAKAAAFEDRRFYPLEQSEYPYCSIDISLLTLPEAQEYDTAETLQQKLRPGYDGVILQHGQHTAAFLPQVWEEYPDFNQFFGQLGIKAGLRGFALDHHPAIYTFQADRFEDSALGEAYIPALKSDRSPQAHVSDDPSASEQPAASETLSLQTPQEAEAAFYAAIENSDIDAMRTLWSNDDTASCIHPGSERLQGFEAITASWRAMFASQSGLHFEVREVKTVQEGSLSIHTLRERIFLDDQPVGMALSTNVYRLENDQWHMLVHHASPAMG